MNRVQGRQAAAPAANAGNTVEASQGKHRVTGVLESLSFLLAAGFILLFLGTALARVSYPYELEWMEGAMVQGVLRLLNGSPLYVQPSIDYIPFIYPPLYFYVSAAVSLLTGPGFLPLRLVSLFSMLGSLVLLYCFTRRATGSGCWGVVSAGLFAAGYAAVDGWYDISRVDPLAVFLLLSAVYVIRFHRSRAAGVGAGLLLSLAFFTKQASLLAALPLLLYWLLFRRQARWSLPLAFILLSAGGVLLLNALSGGWYFYSVFALPGQHPILAEMLYRFWFDLLRPLAVACMLALLLLLGQWEKRQVEEAAFSLALLAGFLGAAYLGRLHPNAHVNVLITAFAGLALTAPRGYLALAAAARSKQAGAARQPSDKSKGKPGGASGEILFSVVLLLQFLLLAYNPLRFVPDAADRAAGDALLAETRLLPGEVYLPYHGWLAELAGKHSYAHAMAVSDVLAGEDPAAGDALRSSMQLAFSSRMFDALVLDSAWMEPEWQGMYECRPFNLPEGAFWPPSGMQTRPDRICTPAR